MLDCLGLREAIPAPRSGSARAQAMRLKWEWCSASSEEGSKRRLCLHTSSSWRAGHILDAGYICSSNERLPYKE